MHVQVRPPYCPPFRKSSGIAKGSKRIKKATEEKKEDVGAWPVVRHIAVCSRFAKVEDEKGVRRRKEKGEKN